MLEYHIFLLRKDGHIFTRNELFAGSDSDAIEKAKITEAPHDIEVWSGERLIWSGKPASTVRPLLFLVD